MNTLECIKTRHSTRKFKPEPVAQELLDTVIDAGRRAPTGGNLQPTHFMVITNPDVLKELVTLVQEEYGKTEVTEQTPPYMVNPVFSPYTRFTYWFVRYARFTVNPR